MLRSLDGALPTLPRQMFADGSSSILTCHCRAVRLRREQTTHRVLRKDLASLVRMAAPVELPSFFSAESMLAIVVPPARAPGAAAGANCSSSSANVSNLSAPERGARHLAQGAARCGIPTRPTALSDHYRGSRMLPCRPRHERPSSRYIGRRRECARVGGRRRADKREDTSSEMHRRLWLLCSSTGPRISQEERHHKTTERGARRRRRLWACRSNMSATMIQRF